MPLVCTNDVHYLRMATTSRTTSCCASVPAKSVNDEHRLRYHGDQFFLKSAAQMAQVFGDYPQAMANTLLIAERCNVTIPSGENHLPNFDVPEGFTLEDYFEHDARRGLHRSAWRACGSCRGRGQAAAHHRRSTSERLDLRDRR